jgi:16S rRNA (guanine(966)-N(2))-methyltransferase RsmD
MRVIAGSAKGIQLQAVPGTGTRPVSDKVKESLFNILGDWIVDARVLDLFGGTGSVGIEALSRGAAHVTFVEKNPRAIATIKDNLKNTRLEDRARVVQGDAFAFLRAEPEPFDLIYIAPPQYEGLWRRAIEALEKSPGWLYPEGLAVVQIFPKEFEPVTLRTLELTDERKYGSTLLCFYDAVSKP